MVNLCHLNCIFFRKKVYHTSTKLCHIKKIPRNIAARLPHLYHTFTTEKNTTTFATLLGRKNAHFITEKVYHKVYHRMAVDVLNIFKQKCKGFYSHVGGMVDSVVFWVDLISPHWCVSVCVCVSKAKEGCANSYVRE